MEGGERAVKQEITTSWQVGGHYSHGILANGMVFVAGQTAGTPGSRELSRMDIAEQTASCIDRIRQVLESAGASLVHVVKTTCYLADIRDFQIFDQAYRREFHGVPPARSTIQVGKFPEGLLVEIEAIAVLPTSVRPEGSQ